MPAPTFTRTIPTPSRLTPVTHEGKDVGGGYRLVKRIGSGGFGEVWRAEAPGGGEVAVKIIFRPLDNEESQRELQSLDLIKRLAADAPSAPGYQHDLAGTLNNLAKLLTARGDPLDARRLLERAIVHERAALVPYPGDPFYRENLRTQHGNLTTALLRQGEHAAAATAGTDLAGVRPPLAADARAAATILAKCSGQTRQDPKLPEDQRDRLSRSYADQAVALLQQAVRQGYHDAASLRKGGALAPLRQREDFRQLLAELDAQAAPKGK